MKTKKFCVLLYVLGFALAASAQDIDRYEDFWKQGVLDIKVSNQTANDIVLAGITSNNADVVNLTIKAMGKLIGTRALNIPIPFDSFFMRFQEGPVPMRAFQEVPGLKEFLINHWMEQYESHGYIQESLEGGIPDMVAYIEEADLDEVALLEELEKRSIGWTRIPVILCTWWPGDSDVHELLWYRHETKPDMYEATLYLLNVGNFTTPEADAFRIRHLSLPSDSDDGNFIAVGHAAVGLAMNHPIEALPHLITAGEDHPSAIESILVALSSYDDDKLVPYAEDIQSMLVFSGKPTTYADRAISVAYERLNMFTELTLTDR